MRNKEEKNIKLIIATPCPFCKHVTDFIEERDLNEVEVLETSWDPKVHQSLKNKYGKTQVPLLLINDQPLYESQDIISYLGTQL